MQVPHKPLFSTMLRVSTRSPSDVFAPTKAISVLAEPAALEADRWTRVGAGK